MDFEITRHKINVNPMETVYRVDILESLAEGQDHIMNVWSESRILCQFCNFSTHSWIFKWLPQEFTMLSPWADCIFQWSQLKVKATSGV